MANPLIVLNWKLNPGTTAEARTLFAQTEAAVREAGKVDVVVCPPAVYLQALKKGYRGRRVAFGAQDCFWEDSGPYTGALAPGMLRDAGARYVILGHSERRALGETDEIVRKKITAALGAGLLPIICIGERQRGPDGAYLAFLGAQIRAAVEGLSEREMQSVLFAYEPIWAVGEAARGAISPEDLHETILFIRKQVARLHTDTTARALPVLYGGSVEAENTAPLLLGGETAGLLVGRASLVPERLQAIIRYARAS